MPITRTSCNAFFPPISADLLVLILRQRIGKAVFQRSATGAAREKRLPFAEIRGKEIHSHNTKVETEPRMDANEREWEWKLET